MEPTSTKYLKVIYDFCDVVDHGDNLLDLPEKFALYYEWDESETNSILRSFAALNLAVQETPDIIYHISEHKDHWDGTNTLIRAMQSARFVTLPNDVLEEFEKKKNLAEFATDAEHFIDELALYRIDRDVPSDDRPDIDTVLDRRRQREGFFSNAEVAAMRREMEKSSKASPGLLFPLEKNSKKRKRDHNDKDK